MHSSPYVPSAKSAIKQNRKNPRIIKNLPIKSLCKGWVILYELSILKDYKGATVSWLISEMFWSWSLSLGWQKIGIPILGKGHAPKFFLALGQVIWPSHIDPSIYLCLKWLFWRQFLSAWLTGSTVSSGIRSLCPCVFCFLFKDHSGKVRGRHCITCIWNADCLPIDTPS